MASPWAHDKESLAPGNLHTETFYQDDTTAGNHNIFLLEKADKFRALVLLP